MKISATGFGKLNTINLALPLVIVHSFLNLTSTSFPLLFFRYNVGIDTVHGVPGFEITRARYSTLTLGYISLTTPTWQD